LLGSYPQYKKYKITLWKLEAFNTLRVKYLCAMSKAVKKKSAKEASTIFHNIIQASVKGNPKPVPKKKADKNKND
jgi:hypothetical protein